ncbi:MAG: S-methyl-5'-thioinosine phosphorylase [Armatimonadetes bacterium]|nr:S-methyl-5'-thioinosine phosphorylase [Armatimonadota bacterium]
MSIGIIGGTGLYGLTEVALEPLTVDTAYGPVAAQRGQWHAQEVIFVARHGAEHNIPPHAVNYRANLAALKQLGVSSVLATAATGTLSRHIPPGGMALLTDFIDLVSGRPRTFFEDLVVHVDYSEPYCPHLRAELSEAAAACGLPLHPGATYVCTNGPRFETPAEIRVYSGWGGDLVGMTNVPEVVLAREAELCYAAVAIATNAAAGVAGQKLTHREVEETFAARLADLARLFEAFVQTHGEKDCPCRHALDEYRERMGKPELSIPL